MRRAFEDPGVYPSLARIQRHWRDLREEALQAIAYGTSIQIADDRVAPGDWTVLPLLPEPEDRAAVPGWEANRDWAPRIFALLESEPSIVGHSLSYLRAGGTIGAHRHEHNFVTAILTLQTSPGCHVVVDGERHDVGEGATCAFDYRRVHEAHNPGPTEWVSLLMLLAPNPSA